MMVIPLKPKAYFFIQIHCFTIVIILCRQGKYLSIFYKGPSTRTKIAVDKLITFAKEHHMKIVGDPIEFCHIDDYETSIDDECLTEIQLPIK